MSSSLIIRHARNSGTTIIGGGGGIGFQTLALLNADLAHDENTLAEVTNDAPNNGTYIKVGASGAGSWLKSTNDVSGRVTDLETNAVLNVGGEVQDDTSFGGKLTAPGNDLSTGDEVVTRDIGDARYLAQRRGIDIFDDFLGNNTTNGQIGALGWDSSVTGTGVILRAGYANGLPGLMRVETNASAPGAASLYLHVGALAPSTTTSNMVLDAGIYVTPTLADGSIFIGWANSTDTDGVGLHYNPALSPNWRVRQRDGGATTYTDTGKLYVAANSYIQTRVNLSTKQIQIFSYPSVNSKPTILNTTTFASTSTADGWGVKAAVTSTASLARLYVDYVRIRHTQNSTAQFRNLD